ncbi:MAG: hypothetical protein IIW54_05900, partial [Lachnospiraceae bacterium]|nr:hypothetical protein [Lachnospiraceae bacterium]
MKNTISCVDLPKGDSKTKENVLSFKSNGSKVILSNRTEERSYNGCVIVEKDKTRISTEENGIRIV